MLGYAVVSGLTASEQGDVLLEVNPLEEVRGHQVLEPLRLSGHEGPVEVIVLLRLLHGSDPGRPVRRETEQRIEPLEDREPSTLAEDVDGYAISHDGKKVLVGEATVLAPSRKFD